MPPGFVKPDAYSYCSLSLSLSSILCFMNFRCSDSRPPSVLSVCFANQSCPQNKAAWQEHLRHTGKLVYTAPKPSLAACYAKANHVKG
jgi:hypothetical protein